MYDDNDFDFGVDLGNVEESKGFDLVPSGVYSAQAVAFEVKKTKDQLGEYVSAQFEVVSGEFAGRKIFENYNTKNSNAKAVQIALSGLKSLVVACGGTGQERLTLSLLNGLCGTEFDATVKIEKGNNGYEDKNRIGNFKPVGATTKTSVPTPAPAAQSTAPKSTRPWEKK